MPANSLFTGIYIILNCSLVGMTGFEPATPRPPDVCATGLRYIPKSFTGQQMYKRFGN